MTKVRARWDYPENKLEDILDPEWGSTVYFSGAPGTGKTHELVNYIHHLVEDLDRAVITNIQFEKRNHLPDCPKCGRKLKVSSAASFCPECDHREAGKNPEDIYFATKKYEMWKKVKEIRYDNTYKPIVPVIDEFHYTVDRFDTLNPDVVKINKWLSQSRKFIMGTMFCTQFVTMIPRRLLKWTDYFQIKKPQLAKKFNVDGDTVGKQQISFTIPIKGRKFNYLKEKKSGGKVVGHEWEKEHVKHFEEEKINDLREVSGAIVSTRCELNDPDRGDWQYRHRGAANFEVGEINDDQGKWFPDLMDALGEVGAEELPHTIEEFFEEYEAKGDDEELPPREVAKMRLRSEYSDTYKTRSFTELEELTKVPRSTIQYHTDQLKRKELDGIE